MPHIHLAMATKPTQTLLMGAPPVVFELLRKSFWRQAGFEPTEIERVLLSVHCSTSKPPQLDEFKG